MENFTIEEKVSILHALDHYIDAYESARHKFADSGELLPDIWKLKELRGKIILDIAPLVVKEASDLFKQPCILCGELTRGGSPKWAFVDNKKICQCCFEKLDPTLYEVTETFNKEYYIKEYPDHFNADGKLKQGKPVNVEDWPFPE